MENYKLIFEKVDLSRGAPMGRKQYLTHPGYYKKVHLQRVPLPIDGAYDKGGAYWGCGEPLWCAEFQDDNYPPQKDGYNADAEGRAFVRAATRERAKVAIKNLPGWQNVRFYR